MLVDPKAKSVRGVAALHKKDARSQTGLFLLEGAQGLKEAVGSPELLVEVFATDEAIARHGDLLAAARATGRSVTAVSPQVLAAMSDTKTPQGIISVCRQLHVDLAAAITPGVRLAVLLANIRDPGNAGTILRAADAAGADAVIFSDNSVDAYNSKVVRSTTGSLFHLPIVTGASIDQALAAARQAGLQVFAADSRGQAVTGIPATTLAAPTLWVFGNEAWGLTPELRSAVDRVVSLPIYGSAESLNLAAAASVCLYQTAFAQNG